MHYFYKINFNTNRDPTPAFLPHCVVSNISFSFLIFPKVIHAVLVFSSFYPTVLRAQTEQYKLWISLYTYMSTSCYFLCLRSKYFPNYSTSTNLLSSRYSNTYTHTAVQNVPPSYRKREGKNSKPCSSKRYSDSTCPQFLPETNLYFSMLFFEFVTPYGTYQRLVRASSGLTFCQNIRL
jgi:hypothetical protein